MSVCVSTKIISAFLVCIDFVCTAKLEVLDYSQNDSNTKCQSGVLLGVDQSALKSVIHLDRSVGDYDYANFEIKEEWEPRFKQLVTIDLAFECVQRKVKENFEFSCEKLSEKEFRITLLLKACREYSRASIRGFLLTVDPNSKVVQLPAVYEPTNATGQLIINGQDKPTDTSCDAVIDTSELNLEFKCISSAKPCVIEIHVDKALKKMGENDVVLKGKTTKAEELYVTIKYAACRLDGENITINCRINMSTDIVSADKIQLFDYSQEDSKTTCRSGVLLNIDQSGFRSVIQLDNSVGDYFIVKYEIKEELKPSFEQLLSIDLAKQCKLKQVEENTEFSCRNVSETEYHITILVKALREYSNATVRGFVYTDDPNSKRVQLPVVFEPTKATGQLIINGQDKPTDTSCYVMIDTGELNLEFKCISSAKPCVIEIHMDNSVKKMGENDVVLKRKTTKAEELYVTIKYAACRLDGEIITINCRINMSNAYSEKKKADHHDNTSPIIGIVIGIVGGILTLIVGMVLYKFTKCFGMIKPKPKSGKEKNLNKTDPESASADTTIMKTGQNDDNKTANVLDTTED